MWFFTTNIHIDRRISILHNMSLDVIYERIRHAFSEHLSKDCNIYLKASSPDTSAVINDPCELETDEMYILIVSN